MSIIRLPTTDGTGVMMVGDTGDEGGPRQESRVPTRRERGPPWATPEKAAAQTGKADCTSWRAPV
jgi:hypothetical protein